MSDDSNCRRLVRPLYAWEAAEARQVFGDSLRYDRIRIHECATWADAIDRLGRWLKKQPPPGPEQHNSVTLGYHCYFPVSLPDRLVPPGDLLDYCMPWLIHELTHAWQYQHVGWSYLVRALAAQFRYGTAAYDFGGEANLVKCRQNHWTIARFNPEQQGDIARYYYYCLRSTNAIDEPNKQNALSAYKPYICDIQEIAQASNIKSKV